jgi:hypothetical protein
VALLATLGGDARTQPKIDKALPPMPGAQAGLQFLVLHIDGDKLIADRTITAYREELRLEKRNVDGKEVVVQVRVRVPFEAMVREEHDLKNVQAFTADGKPIEAADLKKRLAKPTGALATHDALLVQKAGLRALLKDDTLLVVLPHVNLPPPPPRPEPEVKPPPEKN